MARARAARAKCEGRTAAGKRCKRTALDGSPYCRQHGPKQAADLDGLPLGPVGRAVARDIAALGELGAELVSDATQATAAALAREIDDPDNSATSKATCARALGETMDRLRALVPAEPPSETDPLDDLSDRRAARLAGRSGA